MNQQLFYKNAQREIDRLFPDQKAIVTSKPLLKNLNLSVHTTRPKPDPLHIKDIENEDKQVEQEL